MCPIATFADLHDARVEAVEIRAPSVCRVSLAYLYVFEKVAEQKYEGWAYTGKLEFLSVTRIELEGPLPESDYLVDGSILRPDGADMAADEHGFGVNLDEACGEATLTFFSGAILRLQARRVRFVEVERKRYVDDWTGPLTPEPG